MGTVTKPLPRGRGPPQRTCYAVFPSVRIISFKAIAWFHSAGLHLVLTDDILLSHISQSFLPARDQVSVFFQITEVSLILIRIPSEEQGGS